jgi:NAD(P)-dependent dehydrogenase (short-subunit alcohol dehydrogenase family)
MRMRDKVAVLTGGASGIGKRTAERFIEEGGRVVIADVQDNLGERVTDRLGDRARFVHCDVTQEADIEAAVALADTTWGRLDLMFNNAGRGGDQNPIATMPLEGWDGTMNLLLRSVMLGIKHATPIMKHQGFGSIVSTASVAGLVPGSTATAYSVAKSAVIFLTKCAAIELAAHGIRVNCICPGFIATPIFTRNADLPSQVVERVVDDIGPTLQSRQPLPKTGRTDDIANGVLYLADDHAGFVTGVAFPIDGGFAAGTHPGQREALWEPIRSTVAAVVDRHAVED